MYFSSGDFAKLKIPEVTIARLSMYSRYLQEEMQNNVSMIMSSEIASGTGVNAAQVRKDLAYFGEFGLRGVGYNVKELNDGLMSILGLNKEWRLAVVGAGNIGKAISLYTGFSRRSFKIAAIFDNDPAKVGQRLHNLEVQPIENIYQAKKNTALDIGVITVPAKQAQNIADILVEAEFTAILNFAPMIINVPDHVKVKNIDLCVNLELLTFKMAASRDGYTPLEEKE